MMQTGKTLEEMIKEVEQEKELDLYFVLDRSAVDSWPDDLWTPESNAHQDAWPLFGEYGKEEHLDSGPYLIKISDKSKLRDFIVEKSLTIPLGIFVVSVRQWSNVLREARAWLWPVKQSGDQVYFRYYDPRVCTAFCAYYEEGKEPVLMGSFYGLFWYDPGRRQSFQVTADEIGDPFNMEAPWLLEPDLEEALIEAYIPYRLMTSLRGLDENICAEYSDADLYLKVCEFIEQAASYNVIDLKDLLRFCHLSFLFPGFSADQEIAARMKVMKTQKLPNFNAVVQSIPAALFTPYKAMR